MKYIISTKKYKNVIFSAFWKWYEIHRTLQKI